VGGRRLGWQDDENDEAEVRGDQPEGIPPRAARSFGVAAGELKERLEAFALEVHPDKTRIIGSCRPGRSTL
jgi:hypothetical protein